MSQIRWAKSPKSVYAFFLWLLAKEKKSCAQQGEYAAELINVCAEGAADDKNGVGRMSPDFLISNGMVQKLPILPGTWHRTQSSSCCSQQFCLGNGSASLKTESELTKTKTRMRRKGYKTLSRNLRLWPFLLVIPYKLQMIWDIWDGINIGCFEIKSRKSNMREHWWVGAFFPLLSISTLLLFSVC